MFSFLRCPGARIVFSNVVHRNTLVFGGGGVPRNRPGGAKVRVRAPAVRRGVCFYGFWALFGVPGEALLETFSQLFVPRRSWGAIGRDSESDFSGNDFVLGFGASFSQNRGLREALDVHLDWAGAAQTHFGLFARRFVKSHEKSPKGCHLGVFFEGFGAYFGTGHRLFEKKGSNRALFCTVVFPSRFSWILGSGGGAKRESAAGAGQPLGSRESAHLAPATRLFLGF